MDRKRFWISWLAFLATFGWLFLPEIPGSGAALWPSVLAVGLAFVTRDIYLSLFLGALAGAILLNHGDVAGAFIDLFSRYLLPALADRWNISVLVFTLMMGGFVEVLNRNGGMAAMARWILGRRPGRRRAGMGIFLMGWIVFVDGLANSMLVGKSMRPVADRAGLSREKLSFIVDSTSSPIAGLALISTWVAYEMSVIREGFANLEAATLGANVAPFQLLVESLPFRFYNYYCLAIVFFCLWLGRDIGPMVAAEARCKASGQRTEPEEPGRPDRSGTLLAVIPLLVLLGGVFGGLYVQGGGLAGPPNMANMIEAFGKADAALIFVCATACAVVSAVGLSRAFAAESFAGGVVTVFFDGMKQMFLPALVLVFAWTLNGVIKEIGAASFLVSFLEGRLTPEWLPALVFVLAALISFSTGTSWGTMAVVMPLVIPVAVNLAGTGPNGAAGPVVVGTIGAVLAGAVFGDHCSPISDTTLVSAISSDCDPMEHVRTQLPYALIAACLAVAVGYGPTGWGVSPLIMLPIGGVACWAVIRYLGK